MGRITKDDRCLNTDIRSYPKNKTGYPFLDHPV